MTFKTKLFALGFAASLVSTAALAADPATCKAVKFADVGWTDITATTAAASVLLKGLGYEPHTDVLAVPVTYTALHNKQIDVFLGNWMPTMEADRKAYDRITRQPAGESLIYHLNLVDNGKKIADFPANRICLAPGDSRLPLVL